MAEPALSFKIFLNISPGINLYTKWLILRFVDNSKSDAMKKGMNLRVLFLLPAIILILANGCKKPVTSTSAINDIRTLKEKFANPPAEYTTSPFFVWNADITTDEIDRFMTDFSNAGSRQVFVHPRPGLITEYMSEKWYQLFRHTVDKGKELGMKVWIYDENSYPSGFAGGHVPAEMPESYNQGQGLMMNRAAVLPDTAGKYFIVLKEDNGAYRDITGSVAKEKGTKGNYCLFYKTYNDKSDWYGGFSYVDLLYPGVTQKFIELTMKGYEKVAGDEFGKTVPGTFTDEPQITSPGGIRFTPDLFNEFRDKWGYDLRTSLPSLFEETGDWKRIRHNYTQTLLDLFIERWSKPWNEYCESRNLKFTGHYWEHEWPGMQPGGDNMAMYIFHQQPAIDMLFNQFNDSVTGAQFGNIRSVKELASAANQAGRNRKLSETYGGSGWDLTFADMKRNGDWEFVLGINQMNQHLTFFSMEGARKYDYPPTFDYHEPWWNNYRYINDHFARLSLALSSGKQKNEILVLEPTTSAWLYDSYIKADSRRDETGQRFQSFVTMLEKNQVEYDLGSERIIKELGRVKGANLVVGDATYSKLVIAPLTENINSYTFNLIKKFVAGGGTVVALSKPTLVDGRSDKELQEFFGRQSDRLIILSDDDRSRILSLLGSTDVQFSNVTGGTLYHHTRILDDGKLIFMVNSSTKEQMKGTLSATGTEAYELNTFSGLPSGYNFRNNGRKVDIDFSLPPAGSLLLYVSASGKENLPAPAVIGSNPAPVAGTPSVVTTDSLNALTIDFCDLAIGNESYRDLYFWEAADRVFKHFGFRNGDPWNTSVQYKTNIVDRDTFGIRTGFTAAYHFSIENSTDVAGILAVVERPRLWTVKVNGNEVKADPGKWWLDRSFGVYEIGKFIKHGDNELTVSASPMTIHSEIEPVYLLGRFGLKSSTRGWTISKPADLLRTGSLKSQGMPFYSWGVNYTREYNIPEKSGRFLVVLDDWKGTVSEVFVNDVKAGVIAFPPYELDVTDRITAGKTKITVRVTGSLRNLEGPFHNNPPSGFASPWNWRYVKKYPAGKDYNQPDFGLMKDFTLMKLQ